MQDILFNLRFQGICGSGDDCSSFECNKQRTDRQPLYVEQPHCIPDFRITASLQHRCTPIGNRCRKCSPCIPIPFLLLSPIHCNPCKPDIGSHFGIQGREISLDKDNIQTELESGHPIICAMRPGDFTTTGHFIVLTGMKDGKICVHDPNSKKRSEKLWDYETLEGQINNLWSFTTLF